MTVKNALEVLADSGYAVCAFSPEELRGASVYATEYTMTKAGAEMIEFLATDWT